MSDASDPKCAWRAQGSEASMREQRLATLGFLAASVAHDLNNLLCLVTAGASLLAAGEMPPAEVRRNALDIQEAARRAAKLVGDLLSLGRPAEPRLELLDLTSVVADAEPMLRRLAGPDITLRVVLSDTDCLVRADRLQLEQVLLNLVSNARDAMNGRGLLSVGVSATRSGGRRVYLLSVCDSGCGMDPATQRRIFEPFFTTKGAQGMGLGLSIVRRIVEGCGGSISVESASGVGTSFHVVLPVATPSRTP